MKRDDPFSQMIDLRNFLIR